MQKVYKNSALFIGIVAASAMLGACGGSGGSSSGASSAPSAAITGKAVDFYLAGSTVTFLDCGNKTTLTDANGNFTFPALCVSSALSVSGGKDSGTGVAFKGVLKTPATNSPTVVVSVLTTLLASGVSNAQLVAQLGLPAGTNLQTLDPMTNATALKANIILQQLLDQVSSSLVGGSTLTAAQAEQAALGALVTQLNANSSSTASSIFSSPAAFTTLIQTAGTNAGLSASTSASIATNNATAVSNNINAVNTALATLTIGANTQATIASLGTGLTALTNIATATATSLSSASATALSNYLQLSSIKLNTDPSVQIAAAGNIGLTTTGGLTDVQATLAEVGSPFANGSSIVNAGLSYTINGSNTVNLIINGVVLGFNSSGALISVNVPTTSTYSYSLSGALTASGTFTSNKTGDSLFAVTNSPVGNLDLSVTSFLSKLAAASGQSVTAFTPKSGDKVTVALTMAPAGGNTSLTVGTGSGAGAIQAPNVSVTVATASPTVLAGQGVNASVTIN